MQYRISIERKLFICFDYIFCLLITGLCLLPLVHILAISFSSMGAIYSGKISFFPIDFTLDNYIYILGDNNFFQAFSISIQRVLLGVSIQLLLVILTAYPVSLSRHKFHARQFYVWFLIVTMLFSGGLIPTYLVVNKTGLINSIWALILPGSVQVFLVILMQNFMKELPIELSESATIDGAGHFRILFQIILPLCQASVATLVLFIAVGHWNAWFDGMLYINDNLKFPLQTYLRTIIVEVNMDQVTDAESLAKMVASTGADTAKIFIAMLPILLVYPFIQRYFVTGIVIGSVKE